MRAHTVREAAAVVDCVEAWQQIYLDTLGRRLVYVGDEYYLLAERPFPASDAYDDFAMHEDGVGMARTLERELFGEKADATGKQEGFFAWADAVGIHRRRLRALPREPGHGRPAAAGATSTAGTGGDPHRARTARGCSSRCVRRLDRDDVRLVPVDNQFFGGTTAVTGLLVGEDLARVAGRPARGSPLPAARRVPLQRPLPRRHRARGPPPAGRDHRHRRPRAPRRTRADRA